jgi:hypothetical protein
MTRTDVVAFCKRHNIALEVSTSLYYDYTNLSHLFCRRHGLRSFVACGSHTHRWQKFPRSMANPPRKFCSVILYRRYTFDNFLIDLLSSRLRSCSAFRDTFRSQNHLRRNELLPILSCSISSFLQRKLII